MVFSGGFGAWFAVPDSLCVCTLYSIQKLQMQGQSGADHVRVVNSGAIVGASGQRNRDVCTSDVSSLCDV